MKTCPICQAQFEDNSRRKDRVYCSVSHREKAARLAKPKKTDVINEIKQQIAQQSELLKQIQERIEAQYQRLLKMNEKK